jgi:hypothetical protein
LFENDTSKRTLSSTTTATMEQDPVAFLASFASPSSPPSSSQDESSSSYQGGSPPDWSQFSTLWDPSLVDTDVDQALQSSALQDLNLLKPTDMFLPSMDLDSAFDFNPVQGLSINPTTLHFDPNKLFTDIPQNAFLSPSSFTDIPPPVSAGQGGARRLSITSSSSSSGASLSPITDYHSPMPAAGISPPIPLSAGTLSTDATDPLRELAERVFKAAGVTFANSAQAQPDFASSKCLYQSMILRLE